MNLQNIKIKDFMSMQDVDIDFQSGIISVIGRNKDVYGATSNGSGKSALFDAIVWGIFGKCIRSVSGDDVIRRGCASASVELSFTKDTASYMVVRTRGKKNNLEFVVQPATGDPTELTQGIASLTQVKIDEVIGMDYKTFLSVATFDLDALRFARATDKEQKEILERLLNLDVYNQALEKTRKELAAKDKELLALQTQKTYLIQTQESLVFESASASLQLFQHEQNVQKTVDANTSNIATNRGLIDVNTSTIKEKHALIDNLKNNPYQSIVPDPTIENEIKEIEALITSNKAHRDAALETTFVPTTPTNSGELYNTHKSLLVSIESQLKRTKKDRESWEKSLENVHATIGTPCTTCKRNITEDVVGPLSESLAEKILKIISEEEALELEINDKRITVEQHRILWDEATKAYQDLLDKKQTHSGAINRYNTTITELTQKLSQLKIKLSFQMNEQKLKREKEISMLSSEIAQLENMNNKCNNIILSLDHEIEMLVLKSAEYKTRIEHCQVKIDKTKKDIEAQEKLVNVGIDDLAYLKYWEKAFSYSGIRAVLLDDVAAKLTENANKYLKHMMGGSLWIDCHTQSTNKDGEKRERFEVQTFNSFGAGTYYGNSKGEQQRIDIALSLALHDIARTRSNSPIGFTIFDEVFERLDESGCDSIISLLHKERESFGTVFVVSHNPNLTIRFPKQLEFAKQGGITSLIRKESGPVCVKSKPELSTMSAEPLPPQSQSDIAILPTPLKKRGRPKKTVIS